VAGELFEIRLVLAYNMIAAPHSFGGTVDPSELEDPAALPVAKKSATTAIIATIMIITAIIPVFPRDDREDSFSFLLINYLFLSSARKWFGSPVYGSEIARKFSFLKRKDIIFFKIFEKQLFPKQGFFNLPQTPGCLRRDLPPNRVR